MDNWVDFKAVKQAVSMEQALQHYGIALRRVNPATLRGRCPLPSHGSKESHQSFSVNTAKNVWSCQSSSCVAARGGTKGGNILDFTAAMESCTVRDAALKLASWFGISSGAPPAPGSADPRTPQEPPPAAAGGQEPHETQLASKENEGGLRNKPLGFTLHGIDPAHPYLAGRGVDAETAKIYGVGYFPGRGSMAGRVAIPIHDENGELVGYAGRAIDKSEPKYKFPAGFHKSSVLYNLHRVTDRMDLMGLYGVVGLGLPVVVVVEGFFDCIRVDRPEYPCVALMGSSLSPMQEELLIQHFAGVVLMLDGDEAGEKGMHDALVRLSRKLWVKTITLPPGQQPDMLSDEMITALLAPS